MQREVETEKSPGLQLNLGTSSLVQGFSCKIPFFYSLGPLWCGMDFHLCLLFGCGNYWVTSTPAPAQGISSPAPLPGEVQVMLSNSVTSLVLNETMRITLKCSVCWQLAHRVWKLVGVYTWVYKDSCKRCTDETESFNSP